MSTPNIADSNGSERVTTASRLATIEAKLDSLIAGQKELSSALKDHVKDDDSHHGDLDRRTRTIEQGAERRDNQIKNNEQAIENLERKDTWGSLIAGALASLGVAIGILKP